MAWRNLGNLAAWALAANLALISCAWGQDQSQPRRVVFVIGNGAYKSLSKLPNPGNDASSIAAGFVEAGYEVVGPLLDLDRAAMVSAVHELSLRAAQADVAVFYFAGHGVESKGENYLLPVDAKIRREKDVETQAIKLSMAIAAVRHARQLKVVILDACRNNPLARRGVGHGKGLANIEPSAGVLVAFAARHGTEALDGQRGQNSPFTAALLSQLAVPGTDALDLFTAVARSVREKTAGEQEPYTYGAVDVGREKRAALIAWRPERTNRARPLFPDSHERELKREDITPLTCGELYLARNEIFSRTGYCFATERGKINFDNNRGCTTARQMASDVGFASANVIRAYEQERGCDR